MSLAKRHTNYSVKKEHYNMVGEALLWTLKRGLGADWNQQTEEAWISCYTQIFEIMLNNCE
ncbi:MAG: globin domain-containing protein [Saprospiraceae bacterium]